MRNFFVVETLNNITRTTQLDKYEYTNENWSAHTNTQRNGINYKRHTTDNPNRILGPKDLKEPQYSQWKAQ